MKWRSEVKSLSYVLLFATSWTIAQQAPLPWDFPGKSTGVSCHFLLQRIFPTQVSNLGLLHCRQTLYQLSHREVIYVYIYPPFFKFPFHLGHLRVWIEFPVLCRGSRFSLLIYFLYSSNGAYMSPLVIHLREMSHFKFFTAILDLVIVNVIGHVNW